MIKKYGFRKYVVLPTCLLLLNALEEVIIYKSEMVEDPYLRTAVILGLFIAGFSMVAFVISPLIAKWLEGVYLASRKTAGGIGTTVLMLGVIAGLFVLYYVIYILGVEAIVPDAFENPT